MRSFVLASLSTASLTIVSGSWLFAADTAPSPSPRPSASPTAAPKTSPAPGAAAKPMPKASPSVAPPGHVYGNDDLPKPPSPPAVASPGPAGAGKGAVTNLKPAEMPPAPAEEPTPEPPYETTERYWQERAGSLRQTIADTERRITELEQKIGALRDDRSAANAMDPNREQHRQDAIAQAQADLERARADLGRQRQAWDALEEEARRKSVPPGWLRERPEQ
jgi:hypothetical protein